MKNQFPTSFQIPEEYYSTLFEALAGNNVLLKTDAPTFTILAASPSYLQQTGYTKEAMIGKGIFEAFPGSANPDNTGESDLRASLYDVLQHREARQLPIQRYDVADENGQFVERYWKAVNNPVFSPAGDVAYIIHTAEDITAEIKAEEKHQIHFSLQQAYDKIEKSETALKQFKFMADQASDPFILMRKDATFAYLNKTALEVWGYTAEEAEHLRVPDVDPIYNDEVFAAAFARAQREQIPAFETLHKRKGGYVYPVEVKMGGLILNDQPHLFAIARDITERKKAEKDQYESASRLSNMIERAPVAIGVTRGHEMVFENINPLMLHTINKKSKDEVLGKKLIDVLPELKNQQIIDILNNVLQTGNTFSGKAIPADLGLDGALQHRYFDISYTRIVDADDTPLIMHMSVDVTDQVLIRRKIEENEARLRAIINQSPTATLVLQGDDFVLQYINEPMVEMIGVSSHLIGRPMLSILPHLEGQDAWKQAQQVYYEGISFDQHEVLVSHPRKGVMQNSYYNVSYRPLKEDDHITGIIQVAVDVTEQVMSRQKLAQSEAQFRSLLQEAPFATAFYTGPEIKIDTVNEAMLQLWHKTSSVVGKTFAQALPELEGQPFDELLKNAYNTGIEYVAEDQPANIMIQGRMQRGWYNFRYKPVRNDQGEVYGIVHMAVNVTEQVLALQKLEENEAALEAALQQVRLSKEAAELGTFDMNMKSGYMHWDERCRLLFGISHHDTVSYDRDFLQRLHPDDQERVLEVVSRTSNKSLSNGDYDVEYRTIGAEDGIIRWVRAKGKMYFDQEEAPARFIGSVLDITDQKTAMRKIEESQNNLLALFEESPVAIATLSADEDLVFETANTFYAKLVGRTPEQIIGKPMLEALPEIKGQGFDTLLREVIATGKPFAATEVAVQLVRSGLMENIYVNLTYQPRKNGEEITGVLVVAIDVTEQVVARKKVEESEANLRSMVLEAPVGVCVIDAKTLVSEIVNDSFVEIAGKPHEAIIGHRYWDTFAEATPYYKAALQGVVDTGTVFYANEVQLTLTRHGKEEIVYVTFVYMPMRDFEGTVSKVAIYALENTSQVAARQKIEEVVVQRTAELAQANETLQAINKELQRSNANLEEFAHAASHDLKEPVRKIHFFSSKLKQELNSHLNQSNLHSFDRIENATRRMGNLIDDLLLYSHVSQRPHDTEPIDLNEKVQRVLEDLELDIEEKKAVVHVGKLPVVEGYRRQLQQLFQNLLTNSLKYSKADEPPRIDITASVFNENNQTFNVIAIQDNGIGFEQQYADKIFHMFSRLHGKNEYSGTGVGLSIVKKVVENHKGFIQVESRVNEGSTFKIYLPFN